MARGWVNDLGKGRAFIVIRFNPFLQTQSHNRSSAKTVVQVRLWKKKEKTPFLDSLLKFQLTLRLRLESQLDYS